MNLFIRSFVKKNSPMDPNRNHRRVLGFSWKTCQFPVTAPGTKAVLIFSIISLGRLYVRWAWISRVIFARSFPARYWTVLISTLLSRRFVMYVWRRICGVTLKSIVYTTSGLWRARSPLTASKVKVSFLPSSFPTTKGELELFFAYTTN